MVWNLLSNSVKFTRKGGRVQVVLEKVGSHAVIRVCDSGEGISPEFLPLVFDRFRQADASTTRRHGGLGLGLAIVRHLTELHGGTVSAHSPGKGNGAVFTVRLPVRAVHSEAPEPAVSTPKAPDSPASLKGLRIVIVDDEPNARDLVKRVLTDAGASVSCAGSADEALDALRAVRPDVLVSDIGMPGEDGYGLLRRVRQLGTDDGGRVPAVALTAFARAEDRRRALMAGFQMHVAKPVEAAELIAVIASVTHRV